MKRGRLIAIEGTDCSGKQTQSELLAERLRREGVDVIRYSYPDYDSPTGKIVGGPYLGKAYICDGWFPEGASNVDPYVAALYYAADRRYNAPKIRKWLDAGKTVLLDRYVQSNMAHQGGKISSLARRRELYKWLENLEYKLLELPRPDTTIFLHMPYEAALVLKQGRTAEAADQHEASESHLRRAERVYLELAQLYGFRTIKCSHAVDGKQLPRTIDSIADDVYSSISQK